LLVLWGLLLFGWGLLSAVVVVGVVVVVVVVVIVVVVVVIVVVGEVIGEVYVLRELAGELGRIVVGDKVWWREGVGVHLDHA
jgi:hypothetical protein